MYTFEIYVSKVFYYLRKLSDKILQSIRFFNKRLSGMGIMV